MIKSPLVSIIIPTFNRAHLIGETLDSVMSQTYENWECVVVDDGSTDGTETLLEIYLRKDSRVQYYKRPDSHLPGGNGARNYGARKSKGKLLIFLDSDDVLIESSLHKRVENFEGYQPDILLNHTLTFKNVIGDSDVLWNKIGYVEDTSNLIHRYLQFDMPWHTNGPTWNRKFFEKTGGWNESLGAWQDWEMHCRLLFLKPKLCVMKNEIDNYFRISNHDTIGKSYKSRPYMKSIYSALLSINSFLRNDNLVFEEVHNSYRKLIFKMLINFPIKNGLMFFPLYVMTRRSFFKGIDRASFFNFYIFELLFKSYKIKHYILKKSYLKHQEYLKLNSCYLEYSIDEL